MFNLVLNDIIVIIIIKLEGETTNFTADKQHLPLIPLTNIING